MQFHFRTGYLDTLVVDSRVCRFAHSFYRRAAFFFGALGVQLPVEFILLGFRRTFLRLFRLVFFFLLDHNTLFFRYLLFGFEKFAPNIFRVGGEHSSRAFERFAQFAPFLFGFVLFFRRCRRRALHSIVELTPLLAGRREQLCHLVGRKSFGLCTCFGRGFYLFRQRVHVVRRRAVNGIAAVLCDKTVIAQLTYLKYVTVILYRIAVVGQSAQLASSAFCHIKLL